MTWPCFFLFVEFELSSFTIQTKLITKSLLTRMAFGQFHYIIVIHHYILELEPFTFSLNHHHN